MNPRFVSVGRLKMLGCGVPRPRDAWPDINCEANEQLDKLVLLSHLCGSEEVLPFTSKREWRMSTLRHRVIKTKGRSRTGNEDAREMTRSSINILGQVGQVGGRPRPRDQSPDADLRIR